MEGAYFLYIGAESRVYISQKSDISAILWLGTIGETPEVNTKGKTGF